VLLALFIFSVLVNFCVYFSFSLLDLCYLLLDFWLVLINPDSLVVKSFAFFVDSQLLCVLVLFQFMLLAKFEVEKFLHVGIYLAHQVQLLVWLTRLNGCLILMEFSDLGLFLSCRLTHWGQLLIQNFSLFEVISRSSLINLRLNFYLEWLKWFYVIMKRKYVSAEGILV